MVRHRNPDLLGVRQIASNMTEVIHGRATVLYSYQTPVAAHVEGIGYFKTDKKWSTTTSRHINKWLEHHGASGAVLVPQEELERIARKGDTEHGKHDRGMNELADRWNREEGKKLYRAFSGKRSPIEIHTASTPEEAAQRAAAVWRIPVHRVRVEEIASNPRYGWIITKDHLAEPGTKEGTNENAVGIAGPSGLRDEMLAALAGGAGVKFKMYDDDGILYYEGRFLGDADSEQAFGPLDDYGAPNAGATRIDYYNPKTRKWETL